ncbi:hypothetical protein FRC10_000061 [Ceratobasidium sp. 414]|nr:hypothetical protein FRC10_000061 [Ceratobasidium sp. 414]
MTEASVISFISNTRRTRNAALAAMVLLVYDHVITFDAEVDLVWVSAGVSALADSATNGTSILSFDDGHGQKCSSCGIDTALLLSYCSTLSLVSVEDHQMHCLHWQKFQAWTASTHEMFAGRVADKHDSRKCVLSNFHAFSRLTRKQVIIQVRIAAMFSQDRRVLIPMVLLFFVQAIGMATIIGTVFENMQAGHEPVPGFRACTLKRVPSRVFMYWVTNLSFEAILFSLAVFKAWQNFTGGKGTKPSWSGPHILNILVRDSILYFSVIFVTYVMNLAAWSTRGGSVYQLAIALAIALRTSMGSRLLLNIREAYYRCEIVLSENPLSTIHYQQRNSNCVMSFPEHTSQGSSNIPGFEIERLHGISYLDPSSSVDNSAQAKTPSKVTFDASSRLA